MRRKKTVFFCDFFSLSHPTVYFGSTTLRQPLRLSRTFINFHMGQRDVLLKFFE